MDKLRVYRAKSCAPAKQYTRVEIPPPTGAIHLFSSKVLFYGIMLVLNAFSQEFILYLVLISKLKSVDRIAIL